MATLVIKFTPFGEIDESKFVRNIFEPSLQRFATNGNKIATFISNDGDFAYSEVTIRLEAPTKLVGEKVQEPSTGLDFPPKGSIFINHNSYRAPDVVRVVGYTKKTVITEQVPVISDYNMHGGSHKIDTKWLDTHPVSNALISKSAADKFRVDKCEGKYYLTKGKDYYGPVSDINNVILSAEY